MKLADLADRYAFVDPASGRKPGQLKRRASNAAIVVVAGDSLGRIFVLVAWADRVSTNKLVERIFETCDRWQPRVAGVEANGLQSLFGDMLSREAAQAKRRMPLVPVLQPTKIDKDFRIRAALQPVIAAGRLFLRDDMYELRADIATFPMSPKKDLIDALASAVTLVPSRPRQVRLRSERDSLTRYLRESGLAEDAIARRVRELEEEGAVA